MVHSNDWTDLLTDLIKFHTFLSKTDYANEAEILLLSLKENDESTLHKEQCIICKSSITATSFLNGACTNGHEWNRCSACFKCIQSFSYRECMGCNAKVCNNDPILLDHCMICGCKFLLVGVEFDDNL
jgi:hypothetical protein